jgi:hypothetical protein
VILPKIDLFQLLSPAEYSLILGSKFKDILDGKILFDEFLHKDLVF